MLLFILLTFIRCALAQDSPQPAESTNPLTTVHGLVRNGASGQPLPRALVRINGSAATAVLTDGDGHFEIPDVPEGPQDFSVLKPGFLDENEARADSPAWSQHGYGHNVIVIPNMPDVVFTMLPVNSIRGQIQLSTGDVAEGISAVLLRRTVQDGRIVWQNAAATKTNSEGMYRFGSLSDGFYAVYTEPTMDNETSTNLVETPNTSQVERDGYPSVFYPDARDLAGAAKIHLENGDQAQANMTLTLERFHTVSASVAQRALGPDDNISVQVFDAQGHGLPYHTQYDPAAHTWQTALPDGTYSLFATGVANLTRMMAIRNADFSVVGRSGPQTISGDVSFSVAGRPVSNLRIPLVESSASPVQVTVEHESTTPAQGQEPHIEITVSGAGGALSDGMMNSFAAGEPPVLMQTVHPAAGAYWIHTNITPKTWCEASFTAGGANLGHEPLVINAQSTTNAPLTLALRDDCAKLTLLLPSSVGLAAGEERSYTVYLVPDFDSTQDVVPQTLRPSTGGRVTLTGVAPGNYHVYAFDHPTALEYRNPAVLAALASQPVSLAPNGERELTVEVPQP